jgi:hypothetical protein
MSGQDENRSLEIKFDRIEQVAQLRDPTAGGRAASPLRRIKLGSCVLLLDYALGQRRQGVPYQTAGPAGW